MKVSSKVERRKRASRAKDVRDKADGARIPRATYRVQLHSEFRFADATKLVPYLSALGISDLYCSPYLRARPGSRHGYDIVDHTMLNPEIGTREDFDALVAALAAHEMSHMCDVVPNHMAIMGRDNAWWMDVLENGPASTYAAFFDIDWHPADPALSGKVLVPVLGDPYGAVLERGELVLSLERASGTFVVDYHEHRFPLDPRECAPIVELALAAVADRIDAEAAHEVQRLVDQLRALPHRTDADAARIELRRARAPACKGELARLFARHPSFAHALGVVVQRFNGTRDVASSFEPLDGLLEAQAFRLAYWRVASDEINYRRFFDVNDLASLRMEDERVFEATHGFLLGLAAEGRIGALRIDHPDGLQDPAAYFSRLQSRYRELAAEKRAAATSPSIYVAIEKITAPHEVLPPQWAVDGDTGYRFANEIVSVLADPTVRRRVERVWRSFVAEAARDFEQAAYAGKRGVMRGPLAAGLNRLANVALRLAREDRRTRDFTFSTLREALAETVAWFPVYRTYVSESGVSAQDRRYIDWAVSRARRASRVADPAIFDFIRALLLAEPSSEVPRSVQRRYLDFAMRFQQYTAPVTAKGVEDTSFYTYTELVCLNDVGGDPSVFGLTRRAFHTATAKRARAWPHTMLATSTHDNKRSEDVRARIAVISEMPAAWRLMVRRWSRMNRSRRQLLADGPAPSASDEYLLYQTLIGSFPATWNVGDPLDTYRERVSDYMVKAAREAKVRTSWLRIDAEYESALNSFVGALLASGTDNRFVDDLRTQVESFAWYGFLNSLTMTLVKLTVPGVPDFYQGNEILDFSLVDPDNRRPVDYAMRRTLLEDVRHVEREIASGDVASLERIFAAPYEGRAKLWIVYRMLHHRSRHRALFETGGYVPITASGTYGRNVLAFVRRDEQHGVVVVAGRLFASLGAGVGELPLGERWADTMLAPDALPEGKTVRNLLTDETFAIEGDLSVARVFRHFPGCVLAW